MVVTIEDEDVFINGNSDVSPLVGYALLQDLGIASRRELGAALS
jgi:hypothetical protein